jgi:hypothetical protein
MKRNDSTFKELVSRITSGELTRLQAADIYGVNPGTLKVWLNRSNLSDATRLKERPLHGAALGWMTIDPETARLLEDAAQKVLDGTFKSCLAAHASYPSLSLSTLTARVRKARLAQGLPIGRQGKKPQQEPTPAPMPRTPEQLNARLGFDVKLR